MFFQTNAILLLHRRSHCSLSSSQSKAHALHILYTHKYLQILCSSSRQFGRQVWSPCHLWTLLSHTVGLVAVGVTSHELVHSSSWGSYKETERERCSIYVSFHATFHATTPLSQSVAHLDLFIVTIKSFHVWSVTRDYNIILQHAG